MIPTKFISIVLSPVWLAWRALSLKLVTTDIIFQTVMETIAIMMKRETVGFMNDLKDHKDEEIRVRINGTYETLDFSLTDEMKNEILTLYDLYAQGGGTRDSNLRSVTLIDPTIVAKNGKTIDGLAKDKAIDAAIHALL